MLDAFIIDAIRRQERETDQRVWLELPLDGPSRAPETPAEEAPADSVIIIPLHDEDDHDDDDDNAEAA